MISLKFESNDSLRTKKISCSQSDLAPLPINEGILFFPWNYLACHYIEFWWFLIMLAQTLILDQFTELNSFENLGWIVNVSEKWDKRKPSEVLRNPSLSFTTTYLRSAGASALKSGTGLGRGELQRGRWGDRRQEGPCTSLALLQCEAAYIWLATKLCSDMFKQKFDRVWQLNALKISNTLGIFQVCRMQAELPKELLLSTVEKNVFWMIPIICFRWKNKKSCN